METEFKEKILYLEPFSGISGDMFLGSLLDLGLETDWLTERLNNVLPRSARINIWQDDRGGVSGTRFSIETSGEEERRNLEDILEILGSAKLKPEVREKSREMFETLAEVEAGIHGLSREEVHFHEVGALDSIADIVGAASALEKLQPEKIYSGPTNLGNGTVETDHGRLPVPAPATWELLKRGSVPSYSSDVESELTTPTGALILASFVDEFTRPIMEVTGIGYGLGQRELEGAGNFLRTSLGTGKSLAGKVYPSDKDNVFLIETNIDDMNPELFPVVEEKLFRAGALEVYKTPIQMKKNRPGTKLSLICRPEDREELSRIIFRETTSLGVRFREMQRTELRREIRRVETSYGSARVKLGYLEGEIVNCRPEFESCRTLADEHDIPVKFVYREALSKGLELISS